MIHSCEPTLEELVGIRSKLYSAESTDMNVKKIKAIESQIERHKAARDAKKQAKEDARAEKANDSNE